jgi:hypothetical protein
VQTIKQAHKQGLLLKAEDEEAFLHLMAAYMYVEILWNSVTTKSDKWSHQIETRLLAVNDLKDPHIEIKNAPARPRVEISQPLLKANITEVMMGPKADDDAKAKVRKILDDNGLAGVPVTAASAAQDGASLDRTRRHSRRGRSAASIRARCLVTTSMARPKASAARLAAELLLEHVPAGNRTCGRPVFVRRPRDALTAKNPYQFALPSEAALRPTSASGSTTRDASRQRAVFGHLADFYGAFVDAHHRIAESLFVALSQKSSFRGGARLAYGSTKSYYGIQVIQRGGDIVVVQRGSIEIVEEGFHLSAALRSEGSAGGSRRLHGVDAGRRVRLLFRSTRLLDRCFLLPVGLFGFLFLGRIVATSRLALRSHVTSPPSRLPTKPQPCLQLLVQMIGFGQAIQRFAVVG